MKSITISLLQLRDTSLHFMPELKAGGIVPYRPLSEDYQAVIFIKVFEKIRKNSIMIALGSFQAPNFRLPPPG